MTGNEARNDSVKRLLIVGACSLMQTKETASSSLSREGGEAGGRSGAKAVNTEKVEKRHKKEFNKKKVRRRRLKDHGGSLLDQNQKARSAVAPAITVHTTYLSCDQPIL